MKEEYQFPLEDYMSSERFKRIKRFAEDKPTPCLILETDIVKAKFEELRMHLPFAKIFYAVKANPHDEIVTLLHRLGSNFDVATRYELDQLLRLGVEPDRMSFGNTIKKERDIAYFYDKGVRLFATDSFEDVDKLARAAPKAKVFFRILTEGLGADWPLSKKFGCHPEMTRNLMLHARDLGLEPYGLSFHVGSQQRDIGQWSTALGSVGSLFSWAEDHGIKLKMVNMGGGFPANYTDPTNPIEHYAGDITSYLKNFFGEQLPEIIIEPGRSITGDCGVIVTEVVNIAKKSAHDLYHWVFFDIGKFGGLIETLDEAIKYPIYFERSGPSLDIILAGPTCDSMDILYEKHSYEMPAGTKIGERAFILTTGAYTQSYSSIYFNGFPPLSAYILK
ncbi:MAG: ornithine decarboxylase [Spirochaetes bacterium GWD1_61_31]|nr:MAG: ornithine decarboxylase [Spirochaetes bacterium GWB1_60_80]OHD34892.1 MAG: ornithine decarboxylase [Spirochaetes bacterium GWC1_61_12]OHD37078.1 MAG: ornithine decarboxylase [Spirochaetes bacterium GWD1_61_31]OHD44657.1 MAG: ornithine decarboxylase [Spirochaetes bacterium GWE1_60_18]OHD61063.1 MAG: ornithine decarboxylase [Spirochaetes bacterium GWF1_60_12]HAP42721.1 ornithine decarboxylase [Spirochaetaceae bacterium]